MVYQNVIIWRQDHFQTTRAHIQFTRMDLTMWQLLQQQMRLKLFTKHLSAPTTTFSEATSTEAVACSITEFHYDPVAKLTFCT